jgi:hypothetical protein
MPDLPNTFVHRAADGRARSEMFRGMRVGVDGLAKALAADDAEALAPDEPTPNHPPVSCPTCGFIGPPVAVERHLTRTGHGGRPERDDTNNYAHGDDRDPLSKAAVSGIVARTPKKRHTLVAVTPDRFGTDPQTFQHRVWDGPACAPGPTSVTDDDGRKLGRVVEVSQWPFATTPALAKAASGQIPADSYFVGVVWNEEAWSDVQSGRLNPVAVVTEALTS